MPPVSVFSRLRSRSAAFAAVGTYVVGFGILLCLILVATGGHFIYSLDDPYIHLALAERIRHGLYGLNAGEPASPSSSIIWPFLLVPFAGTALMTFVPICINFMCGCAAAWLLGSLVDRYRAPSSGSGTLWLGCLAAALLVIGTNCLGLTFTGLEQTLELLLCICCALLCVAAAERRPIPVWCIAAAAVLPAVRYEGALVTSASIAVLWVANRRRAAVAVLGCGVLSVGLFSAFLRHLGLPALPISVLVKGSAVAANSSRIHGLLRIAKGALKTSLLEPERTVLLALTVVALGLLIVELSHKPRDLVRLMVFAAISGVAGVQLCFGPFGWLFRYEVYAIGFIAPILVAYALGGWRRGSAASHQLPQTAASSRASRWAPVLAGTALLAAVYAPALYATVNSARSVWREQGQMSRLMHDYYRGPVAINDLGLVAYHRDPRNYVLDLAALGSPEAFRLLQKHALTPHLAGLTEEHQIGLVAVYPEWMLVIPPQWQPLAKLCADDVHYGPASSRVMLYGTTKTDVPAMLATLNRFRATLPMGSHMELEPEDTSTDCDGG